MQFEIWDSWTNLMFLAPTTLEYLLLSLYGGVVVLVLVRSRREFEEIVRSRRQMALLAGLLLAPLITTRFLVVRFSTIGLLPPPNIPLESPSPSAALLTGWPILAAGVWLGSGPALLVGTASGVFRSAAMMGNIAEPFHLAFFGFIVAACLRQEYRGRLEALARQPIAATIIAAPPVAFVLLLGVWAHVGDAGLAGLDYALQMAKAQMGCTLLEVVSAAVILQALYLIVPSLRPVRAAELVSPLNRSLSRKLLVVLVPAILTTTLMLVYAVTTSILRDARAQAVRDLARDARSAADEIPAFVQTGQGLLAEFVADERLLVDDVVELEALLRSDLRIGTFFDQLMLFDTTGRLVVMYPSKPTGDPRLTTHEERLLDRTLTDGAPQISSAHRSRRDEAILSFLMPVELREGSRHRVGALMGRTHLQVSPVIMDILADLQSTSGQGEGFVVDSEDQVVAHPDPGMVLALWHADQYSHCVVETGYPGRVCEGRDPIRNTRELVYVLRAEGYPWSVIIRLPYEVVLEQAEKVAVPLLALQAMFGIGMVGGVVLLVGQMTDPLKRLVGAAERIATGRLGEPIDVDGFDEVGRLGASFEDMRARLKDRMSDLSLLLEVSRAVSSTLDLATGMSFVLEGAIRATDAQVARAILIGDEERVQSVVARGDITGSLGEFDHFLTTAVEEKRSPIIIPNLARAKAIGGSAMVEGPIKALIALPVRTKEQMLAVIWIGYAAAQHFEKSTLNFLSMLASQVAVLIENARLFHAVESERSRLAAILESASDAVLVTDKEDRLLLMNPAAEQAFGVRSEAVLGCEVKKAELPPAVVEVAAGRPTVRGESREIMLPDGRVLYANASTIKDSEGKRVGRVAVMRDVTHFKELDEMKSEFLATVSHDLRAPLSFMRGYADRLDAVGKLNETQERYVGNILNGVQRIDDLVTDLLDLSRIEAGLGVERRPCHLGLVLAEAVSSLRSRADAKRISLQIEPSIDMTVKNKSTLVSGDRSLLRQAIVNLVDNAIKYTSEGGKVAADLSVYPYNGTSQAVISIADNGIGIVPDEQVRLFEKFYRTRRGDKSSPSGTGLGLAIVKSIVERHGGKVWVDSRLNHGSTFYVSLPLLEHESLRSETSHRRLDDG